MLPQRPWKAESRQHQPSKDRFVLPLGHRVIVLVSGPQNGVCLLPTELGNKVAKLHRPQLDTKLTVLSQEQAHETKVESSSQGLHSPFLGCKFQSMVLSLAVVAVLCQRPQTRKKPRPTSCIRDLVFPHEPATGAA